MTTGADNSPTRTNYTPGVSERTSGTSKFNHSGVKNVDAQSASNQTVSATREYDAFGNVTSSTGSQTGRFGYGGPYGYQEDEGGLKQLGHRLYDSVAGRFVTKDPVRHGRNWYTYCENNPLVAQDASGLFKVVIKIGPDGNGTAVVIADPGDTQNCPGGELLPKYKGGEVVMEFPVYNGTVGGHDGFPDGTYPIEGVYEGYYNSSGGFLGTTFKLIGGRAAARGTWLHGGKGEKYRKKTQGCIRARESDLENLEAFYNRNKNNGNNHRVEVEHVDNPGLPSSRDLYPPQRINWGTYHHEM